MTTLGGMSVTYTEKQLARVISDCLYRVGFRPGAPIQRAICHFSLDRLKDAIFAQRGSKYELKFTTLPDSEPLRMDLETASVWEKEVGNGGLFSELMMGELFPASPVCFEEAWVLHGLQVTPDDSDFDADHHLSSLLYDDDQDVNDYSRYLQMVAVVVESKGSFEALVQRESPRQLLQVPPP